MGIIDLLEVFPFIHRRKYTLLRALSTSGELPICDELLESDLAHPEMGDFPHQLKLWNFPPAFLPLCYSVAHFHIRWPSVGVP